MYREYLKQVGTEIRIARRRMKLSQTKLGVMAGYDKNVISYIELGKRDGAILTYKRIADALNMDMKEIL